MLGSQTGRRLRVREPFFHGALCRACCEDVHVLCQEDRIMYRLEERTSEVVSGVALPVTQLFFHAKVVSVA